MVGPTKKVKRSRAGTRQRGREGELRCASPCRSRCPGRRRRSSRCRSRSSATPRRPRRSRTSPSTSRGSRPGTRRGSPRGTTARRRPSRRGSMWRLAYGSLRKPKPCVSPPRRRGRRGHCRRRATARRTCRVPSRAAGSRARSRAAGAARTCGRSRCEPGPASSFPRPPSLLKRVPPPWVSSTTDRPGRPITRTSMPLRLARASGPGRCRRRR